MQGSPGLIAAGASGADGSNGPLAALTGPIAFNRYGVRQHLMFPRFLTAVGTGLFVISPLALTKLGYFDPEMGWSFIVSGDDLWLCIFCGKWIIVWTLTIKSSLDSF